MTEQKEMPEELLPCPFCGGKAMHLHTRVKSSRDETVMLDYDQIDCSVCRASTRSYCDNKEGAIKAWNKRAALAPTSQWRSMDTAPRDGTKIIVYRPTFQGNYIPQVGTDYSGGRCGTWQESNNGCQPTMWQPLPAPPTKDLADAEKEKV